MFKPMIFAASAALLLALPTAAEAARCPNGLIYRPTAKVCVSKASAIRAGIYRSRYAKARMNDRAKNRPPIERAAVMPRTPMWDSVAIDRISHGPFGGLIPMPETEQSRIIMWAAHSYRDQGGRPKTP